MLKGDLTWSGTVGDGGFFHVFCGKMTPSPSKGSTPLCRGTCRRLLRSCDFPGYGVNLWWCLRLVGVAPSVPDRATAGQVTIWHCTARRGATSD